MTLGSSAPTSRADARTDNMTAVTASRRSAVIALSYSLLDIDTINSRQIYTYKSVDFIVSEKQLFILC